MRGELPTLVRFRVFPRSSAWGRISVGVFIRAPGEVVLCSDYYRISCVLTDIRGTKQSDDRPVEHYRLRPGNVAFQAIGRGWSPALRHVAPAGAGKGPGAKDQQASRRDRPNGWVRRPEPSDIDLPPRDGG